MSGSGLSEAVEPPASDADRVAAGIRTRAVGDEQATRSCGYCGEEFSYQRTANRPPKYCGREWPEAPRTCQARAKAQRVAQKAAGLDGAVAAYRQAGEAVMPAIAALQETLAGLLTETRKVETAALARMVDAERETQDAAERVEVADTARENAERAQINAERASTEAACAAREAGQRAQAAEQDRDTKVRQAWEQVTHKEGERAAALARAEERAAAATRAEELRKAAHERADTLAAANQELQKRLAEARTQAEQHLARAHADVTAARDDLLRAQTHHVEQLDRLREQAASEAQRLRTERDRVQEVVAGLRSEVAAAQQRAEALSQELQAAQAVGRAATERAETADQRYDQLVTALSLRSDPAPPASGA